MYVGVYGDKEVPTTEGAVCDVRESLMYRSKSVRPALKSVRSVAA